MYVTIINKRLPVVVEQGLKTEKGKDTYELFRPASMDIALDYATPKEKRRFFLVHAIGHAYDHTIGHVAPGDDEGSKNRLAVIEEQFAADWEQQGGEDALNAMFGEARQPVTGLNEVLRVPISADGAEGSEWPTEVRCPTCRRGFKPQSIDNGVPKYDAKLSGFTIKRALTCSFCAKLWRWEQRSSSEGDPWPFTVIPPSSSPLRSNVDDVS